MPAIEALTETTAPRVAASWSRLVWYGGGLIILIIVLLIGRALERTRDDARQAASTHLSDLSLILADNFSNSLASADLGLLALQDEVARQHARLAWDTAAIAAAQAAQNTRHHDSYAYQIVPGPQGQRRMQGALASGALQIGAPQFDPLRRQWSIPLFRRIHRADGSALAQVRCSLALPLLMQHLARVNIGPGGSIGLYHAGLRWAARIPPLPGANPNQVTPLSAALRRFILSGAPRAEFDFDSTLDGRHRLACARKIDGAPYFIQVAFADDDYLRAWRIMRWRLLVVGLFMVTVVLAGMVMLQRRIFDLQRAMADSLAKNEMLRQINMTDGLTGVANRRCFDQTLSTEWRRCGRAGLPLALVMVDVDHFKKYNDQYGHQAGDLCLAKVAETLSQCLRRPHEIVARYGGEEFAMILPHTSLEAALSLADKARCAILELNIPHAASSCAPRVTVSLGVAAMLPDQSHSAVSLLAAADACLYLAKQGGRNRCCRQASDQGLPA